MHYDRVSQLPEGVALATLVATEEQCARGDCDSWKTIGIDMIVTEPDSDEAALLRFALCINHLAEFVEHNILKASGEILEADEDDDCGDPDCPVHGYLHEDEDDDDER